MSPSRRSRRQAAAVGTLVLALVLAPLPSTWGIGPQAAVAAVSSNQSAPTGVQADATATGVYVQWTAKTDGPSGYQVQYDTSLIGLGLGSTIKDVAGGATTSTFINGSFLNSFAVRVRAVYGSGVLKTYSDWSGAVSATPNLNGSTPARPAGLTATPGQDSVVLAWNPPPGDSRTAVKVYRNGTQVATVAVPATTWTDTTGVLGTQYTYHLVAVGSQPQYVSANSDSVLAGPYDRIPPAAPSGLTAVAGDATATLSWTVGTESDLDHYEVTRGGTVTTVPRATPSATFTGLTNGLAHSWSVTAVDRWGNVSAASSVSATPRDTTPPDVPAGLSVSPGDAALTVTWNASAAADTSGYRLYVDGVARPVTTARTAQLTGLVNDRSYSVSVAAVDLVGNESARSQAVAGTPRDLTPPGAPAGLAAEAGDGQVALSWTGNTEADLASYRVVDAAGGVLATVTAPGRTAVVTGLVNGTAQSFRVIAVDTAGNPSAPSAAVSATPRDLTPPGAPTGLTATPGDGSATLDWTTNLEGDVARYDVLDGGGAVVASVAHPATGVVVGGLVNGSASTFRLVAVDRAGNTSAASQAVAVTPRDTTPPAAPSGVAATAGDATAVVTWTASSSADVTRYEVVDQTGTVRATAPAGLTSTTVAGLLNGTTYTFSVVAVDAAGNRSPAGSAAPVTPQAPPLAAPAGLTVTGQDASGTVGWTAVAGAASYQVLLDGAVSASVTGTSAALTGLVNGRTYAVTVRAVAAGAQPGSLSSSVSLTPRAAAPAPTAPPVSGSGSAGVSTTRDGRFSLVGTAAQLEPSDTNSLFELYLRDSVAGTVTRLDPSAAGTDLGTSQTAISADGRFVVVVTSATKVAADTNKLPDVYRFDRWTSTWELVSVPATGRGTTVAGTELQKEARVYSTGPAVALSADGRHVFFFSRRADLVGDDTNGAVDLFRKDMVDGSVQRVSTSPSGGQITAGTSGPALQVTPDGRYVLFASKTQGLSVLWRKDLATGALEVVSGRGDFNSLNAAYPVSNDVHDVSLSDDGRFVAFSSNASQLTSSAAEYLVYRRDMDSGQIVRAGIRTTTSRWEHGARLDPSGRYVFFATTAEVGSDIDNRTDWYRTDAQDPSAPPTMVTSQADGLPSARALPARESTAEFGVLHVLSADSVLVTTMQSLVPADTNGVVDTYSKNLTTGSVVSRM